MDKGKRPMTAAQLQADERPKKSKMTSARRSVTSFYQGQRINYNPTYSATTPYSAAPTFVNNVVGNQERQNDNPLYHEHPASPLGAPLVVAQAIAQNVAENQDLDIPARRDGIIINPTGRRRTTYEEQQDAQNRDEIQNYLDMRYIGPTERAWHLRLPNKQPRPSAETAIRYLFRYSNKPPKKANL